MILLLGGSVGDKRQIFNGLSLVLRIDNYLIIQKGGKVGGLCETIKINGYVCGYSSHFFRFKEADHKA